MDQKKSAVVINVGGSLIVPKQGIDVNFLKELRNIVKNLLDKNITIALIIGGGNTSRLYHAACSDFEHVSNNDIDWIGIRSIRLNAELVRAIFSDLPIYPEVVDDLSMIDVTKGSVFIVAAWEPGHSSDTNAVSVAEILDAKEIINFSNITHVYDKDPSLYSDAQALKKLSWKEYINIIPSNWTPNLSTPFDPIASRKAQAKNIRVAVLGASIENLNAYFQGKEFEGSCISNDE